MKNYLSQIHVFKKGWKILMLLMVLTITQVMAQVPQGVPYDPNPEPIGFNSTRNIVLYIVIPLTLIFLYIVWKRRKSKYGR